MSEEANTKKRRDTTPPPPRPFNPQTISPAVPRFGWGWIFLLFFFGTVAMVATIKEMVELQTAPRGRSDQNAVQIAAIYR
ncbi:hypothetical protein DL770_002335 [Monosporascus sp. CRB-9-2]|nr:hypothetical protein DL770_002335 [Monosporascus sp. CRB-9-2]